MSEGEKVDWPSKLSSFLIDNPSSQIKTTSSEATDANEEGLPFIENPWNDASLRIELSTQNTSLYEALNNTILPERLSAIWHKDTKDLEVIFTAFPLAQILKDLIDRQFTFRFGNKSYECLFSGSSPRLEVIAKAIDPVQSSQTNYRNLQQYKMYFEMKEENDAESAAFLAECKPLSFWVKNVDFKPDETILMLSHLNFYMSYYDTRTPIVVVHQPKIDRSAVVARRFVAGSFPKNITGRIIDDNLLHYWEAAAQGDPARRFLYYYRIIEYAASLYVDQINRVAMKRALAAPNALDDIDRITDEVMTISAKMKMDEYARMQTMLKEYVDVKCLWASIDQNKNYFSTEQSFDGGFKISPLITAKSTIDDFAPNAFLSFVNHIKDIRNALSHGKDQKTQSVIVPTMHNLSLLQPWVFLIAGAAGDLILYRP